MKPAKKNKPGTTKKNESKEELIKKIPNYFQTAVKPVIGGTINEFKNTKPIYVELLKTTLKGKILLSIREKFLYLISKPQETFPDMFEILNLLKAKRRNLHQNKCFLQVEPIP